MRVKWFFLGIAAACLVLLFIGAVPEGGYSGGRYQIAGTEKLVYVLDTQSGEVRFCGIDGLIVSFNPFSDSQEVRYLEKGYCGETGEELGKY